VTPFHRLSFIGPVVVASLCWCCEGHRSSTQAKLESVFAGYTLVQVGPLAGEPAVPTFSALTPVPVPAFQPGHFYVFYDHAGTPSASLALKVLPDRLRNVGFGILQAPRTHDDLMEVFDNDPRFVITFSTDEIDAKVLNVSGLLRGRRDDFLVLELITSRE
jgi:hypothetical protein